MRVDQAGSVKLPYTKAVVKKIIVYLYGGEMACEDLALRPMMNLLEQLNLMNLPKEVSDLMDFTAKQIVDGKFAFSDCVEHLEVSFQLGLETVGGTLLTYLGENFLNISKLAEVGGLSEAVIRRLIEENDEDSSQTIHRLNTFSTWLSVNSVNARGNSSNSGFRSFHEKAARF